MKTAIYTTRNGDKLTIEYDEMMPCLICGEPIIEASMGGIVICPWCDMGGGQQDDTFKHNWRKVLPL